MKKPYADGSCSSWIIARTSRRSSITHGRNTDNRRGVSSGLISTPAPTSLLSAARIPSCRHAQHRSEHGMMPEDDNHSHMRRRDYRAIRSRRRGAQDPSAAG